MSTEKIQKRCENCMFFGDDSTQARKGRCRRFPPTAVIVVTPQGPGEAGVYPPTAYDNTCGEWKKGTVVKIVKNLPEKPMIFRDPNSQN